MNSTPEAPPPGQTLRAAREARNFSLLKVAEELRLPPERVEAMEEGRYDSLGPAVFARGHLRRYAALLQLPAAPLLASYEAAHRDDQVPTLVPPASLHTRVVERRTPLDMIWPVLVPVALAAIVASAWWLQGREQAPPPAPVAAAAEEVVQPAVAAAAEETPAVAPDPGRLAVGFTDLCWIEVYDATGQRLAYQLAERGESLVFPGPAPWRVMLGNADAASLTVDGRAARLPGSVVVQNTASIYVDEAGTVARVPMAQQDES